jgi:hypothetical protein
MISNISFVRTCRGQPPSLQSSSLAVSVSPPSVTPSNTRDKRSLSSNSAYGTLLHGVKDYTTNPQSLGAWTILADKLWPVAKITDVLLAVNPLHQGPEAWLEEYTATFGLITNLAIRLEKTAGGSTLC